MAGAGARRSTHAAWCPQHAADSAAAQLLSVRWRPCSTARAHGHARHSIVKHAGALLPCVAWRHTRRRAAVAWRYADARREELKSEPSQSGKFSRVQRERPRDAMSVRSGRRVSPRRTQASQQANSGCGVRRGRGNACRTTQLCLRPPTRAPRRSGADVRARIRLRGGEQAARCTHAGDAPLSAAVTDLVREQGGESTHAAHDALRTFRTCSESGASQHVSGGGDSGAAAASGLHPHGAALAAYGSSSVGQRSTPRLDAAARAVCHVVSRGRANTEAARGQPCVEPLAELHCGRDGTRSRSCGAPLTHVRVRRPSGHAKEAGPQSADRAAARPPHPPCRAAARRRRSRRAHQPHPIPVARADCCAAGAHMPRCSSRRRVAGHCCAAGVLPAYGATRVRRHLAAADAAHGPHRHRRDGGAVPARGRRPGR